MMCPDRRGIVADVSRTLAEFDANIVENSQFTDLATETFCMRTRFETESTDSDQLVERLETIGRGLDATTNIRREDQRRRALVMVSKYDHCLLDLLYRRSTGELDLEIPVVVSNHADLRGIATDAGADYHHIPVTADTKPEAEAALMELVEAHDIDFVVLARYMQLLSNELTTSLAGRAINIHHSFLPAFKGAKPYHQAWQRGVKVIGATAHYVTSDLDEGPIIAQGVSTVSHRESVEQFIIRGRDVERLTLSTAVRSHAEDRVFLLADGRTVILD